MKFKNEYLNKVYNQAAERNNGETEFLQAVEEVLSSLEPVVEKKPEIAALGVLERMVEPERLIQFRVSWVDDAGIVRVNRGFRVQFNSAIGPYKGGLRFHPTVNASIMKFLGFEQTFKNSLTGLAMGGAKGGADFDPRGKSDGEIMRFCQSFMTELYRHIGPDVDVPAGDIGVGAREIGYLYGQYKRIKGRWENGVLTGKGLTYGGSLIRPEATGYGAVYYLEELLKYKSDTLKGKTVAISGFGNVAWGAALKLTELGAKVITISGSKGYVYDENGIDAKKAEYMLMMRTTGKYTLQDYAEKFGAKFVAGEKPWSVKADIIMPCATQNEVELADAEKIVANGCKYYIEVSNMPTTPQAMEFFVKNNVIVAPSKAVNAGGVAVSGLEMSQNSIRLSWEKEEVDEKLKAIMKNIFIQSISAAQEYDLGDNLIAGANIAGFTKVAQAMIAQGVAY